MWLWGVLALVAAQRLWELGRADRNTRRLLAGGAVEVGAGHYPLFILLHASWLAALAVFTPWSAVPNPWWLGAYVLLQIGRLWVIATLGRFWTTRIITLPSAPLVRRGPYRFMRHPNYVVAALEIAVLPLAFGMVWIAAVWSVANTLLTGWRIRIEDRALSDRRSAAAP
jgi:methyltransferase